MKSLNVEIQELSPDNPKALAKLAWYELVEAIEEKGLPILVVDGQVFYGKEIEILFTELGNTEVMQK